MPFRRTFTCLFLVFSITSAQNANSAGFLELKEKWRLSLESPGILLAVMRVGDDNSVILRVESDYTYMDTLYWISSEGRILYAIVYDDDNTDNRYHVIECSDQRVVFIRRDVGSFGDPCYLHQFRVREDGSVEVRDQLLGGETRSTGYGSSEPPNKSNPMFMLDVHSRPDDPWDDTYTQLVCYEFVESMTVGLNAGTDSTSALKLTATVPAGKTATLQQSEDLTTWTDTQPIQGNADGSPVEISVEKSTATPSQFLRLRQE
ncbi:MAG: hypothetical protein RI897_422 [Verrucomicrobiota bacterium]|jgi:hypothetical protein